MKVPANSCILGVLCLDPVSNPPILRETKGRETPSSSEVISTRQREVFFRLSSSIVSISSTRVGDGKIIIPNLQLDYYNTIIPS